MVVNFKLLSRLDTFEDNSISIKQNTFAFIIVNYYQSKLFHHVKRYKDYKLPSELTVVI